jgi:hypothetical protein
MMLQEEMKPMREYRMDWVPKEGCVGSHFANELHVVEGIVSFPFPFPFPVKAK